MPSAPSLSPYTDPVIDSHLHYVTFFQQTDGMTQLLQAMDAAHVSHSVIMGLPIIKKWDAAEPVPPERAQDDAGRCYYYSYTDQLVADAYASLTSTQQQRFAPLLCGFNPTDKNAVNHVLYLLDRYPFWRGIGEVLLRHDDLTNLTQEEVAHATHPAMDPIYHACVERNLPLHLHQNSNSAANNAGHEYVDELNDVLAAFPTLKLVWAHGGMSRKSTHPDYHALIDTMLARHTNLYIDISWVMYDELLTADGTLKTEWHTIIERYPDRFLVGSDAVGRFEHLSDSLKLPRQLLSQLSPATQQQVATANAEVLFFN